MSLQRIPISVLAGVGALILVALIGLITLLARDIIQQTVDEQFKSSELQLVTSLAQQTQAITATFTSQMLELIGKEEIRATSDRHKEAALALLEETASASNGKITSIARFDFRGEPRYAWPADLDATILTLESPDDFRYSIPPRLLELTGRGEVVFFDIEIWNVVINGTTDNTTLLIAPVESVGRDTEYLVFEINVNKTFDDIFSFIDLGETGQLWVRDSQGQLRYQAKEIPGINSISREILDDPQNFEDSRIVSYTYQESDRQAAIAPATFSSEQFLIILTRASKEARADIGGELLRIFLISVFAVGIVLVFAYGVLRRINRETSQHQEEIQRRKAARAMLEVAKALNSSLDVQIVLHRILGELQKLVPHDSACLLLLEDEELEVGVYQDNNLEEDQKQFSVGQVFQVERVIYLDEARAAREVIKAGHPLVINNVKSDGRRKDPLQRKINSWAGFPLYERDKILGVLNINSREFNRFSNEDADLAGAFADQASVALQSARLHDLEVKQFEQELLIARSIQTSLLPSEPPDIPQLHIASSSLPARQVSGDYFQYLPLGDGRLGIAIGDVTGKGIPAALMMAVISTAMRDEIARHTSAAGVMHALNNRLLPRMKRNHMNTALIMSVFDPKTYTIEMANGGMVQPYIRHPGEQNFESVPIGGYPVGILENMRYSPKTVALEPGSLLIMLTDGVVEAQNPAGEFFGFERVEELLNTLPQDALPEDIMQTILDAVQKHLDTEDPQDDTTIMIIRAVEYIAEETDETQTGVESQELLPVPDTEDETASALTETIPITNQSMDSTPMAEHDTQETKEIDAAWIDVEEDETDKDKSIPKIIGLDNMRQNFELYIPSNPGYEKIARNTIEAIAIEAGFSESQVEDLKTAVSEACMNAIEHGNEEDKGTMVNILISAAPSGLEIRILDQGRKTLSATLPPPGMGDMRGWGLFLIKNLMDVFEIKQLPDGGNEVRMVCYLKPEVIAEQSASSGADSGTDSDSDSEAESASDDKMALDTETRVESVSPEE